MVILEGATHRQTPENEVLAPVELLRENRDERGAPSGAQDFPGGDPLSASGCFGSISIALAATL